MMIKKGLVKALFFIGVPFGKLRARNPSARSGTGAIPLPVSHPLPACPEPVEAVPELVEGEPVNAVPEPVEGTTPPSS